MGPCVAAVPAVCPEAGGPGGFKATGVSPDGSTWGDGGGAHDPSAGWFTTPVSLRRHG